MSYLEYLLRLPFRKVDHTTLDGLLRRPFGGVDPESLVAPQAFWFYRKHPPNEEPRVLPKWLEDPNGIKPPVVWQPSGPF